MKKAEQEVEKQEKTLQDAEDEKRAAEREGRLVLLISICDPYFNQCLLYQKLYFLYSIPCILYKKLVFYLLNFTSFYIKVEIPSIWQRLSTFL